MNNRKFWKAFSLWRDVKAAQNGRLLQSLFRKQAYKQQRKLRKKLFRRK